MTKHLALSIWLVAALAPLASAQPASSAAQAEALFKRGKDLQAQGKLAEACAAFDSSQKLDPTLTTRLKANCREKNGQLASAWGHFLEAEREARALGTADAKQLAKVATTRAAALEKRVSTLQITIAADTAKIAGLDVRRGDEVVDSASWNAPLPIDGGAYTISARAPGRRAWTQTVTVATEKDAKSIEVPVLGEDKAPPKITPPDKKPDPTIVTSPEKKPAPTPIGPERPTPSDDRPTFSPLRGIALGAGVIGLGGIAFGVVRGLSAKSKQTDAQRLCPEPSAPCDNADLATQLTIDGHAHASQANLGFAIGGGLVATAIVLWIVGKPSARTPADVSLVPVVDDTSASLSISGAW